MAKIEGQHGQIRTPRHRGAFYVRQWRGKTVICGWPKAKPRKLTKAEERARRLMREASEAAKRMDPRLIQWAADMALQTQYAPRDLLFMMLYGRLGYFQMPGGRKVFSVATRRDVSLLLDALTQEPGSLLYRAPGGWFHIPPGQPEDVLTMLDGRPQWEPASGGSSGGGFRAATITGTVLTGSSTNYSTKGTVFIPDRDLILTEISGLAAPTTSSQPYMGQVARLDAPDANAEIVEVLGATTSDTGEANQSKWFSRPLTSPVPLTAGTPYLLAMTVTNGLPTEPARLRSVAPPEPAPLTDAPGRLLFGQAQYATKALEPGMTPGAVGTGLYLVIPGGTYG